MVAAACLLALLAAGPVATSATPPMLDSIEMEEPFRVWPPFSADRFRYATREVDGVDTSKIVARTAEGTSITLDGVAIGSGESVDVAGLKAPRTIVLRVSKAGELVTSTYEIEVLPQDFPVIEVASWPGVSDGFLLLDSISRQTQRGYVLILDNAGVPWFYLQKPEERPRDFKRHQDGRLSFHETTGVNSVGRRSGERVVLGEDFHEQSRWSTVGLDHTDFHDFLLLANGNRMFLAYDPVFRDLGEDGGGLRLLEDTVVQEVDSNGDVVFEWRSWGDVPLEDQTRPHPSDYAHGNSLDVDTDGNVLVSLRGTSQVVKIDRESGELLWKLGGRSSDFAFVDDPLQGFCGQHTARRLPNGHLLLFDNGNHCPFEQLPPRGEVTRVLEYELDEDNWTARLVWSYSDPQRYSLSAGSSQRLANGNTLVAWGRNTDTATTATEIDPEGNTVQEIAVFAAPGQISSVYRVSRVGAADLRGLLHRCHADSVTLCLGQGRFEVRGRVHDQNGFEGPVAWRSLTPDSGIGHFYDPANIEVVVKLIDGCAINGHIWLFAAGLTNQGVEILVRDLVTGAQRLYVNSVGAPFEPIQDTGSIDCS